MAPYCTSADLLLTSNLPMPAGLSKDNYVQQGADEINFRLAPKYQTPIVFTSSGDQTTYSATILLLKQLNTHISTGRLIMALDAKGENEALHAYGWSLVQGALDIIDKILAGEIILEGAQPSDGDSTETNGTSRPMIFNLDAFSQVEAFNNLVTTPPSWLVYPPRSVY